MPTPALPFQPSGAASSVEGRIPYRRRFEDAAGRAMTGTVTLTPRPVGAPVAAELRDGWLEVDLRPGVYTLVAMLRTADLNRQLTTDTITVGEV